MDSKRPARREFLKSGAALAGGFTLGGAAPAIGQTPPSPPMIKGDKDQIAYGDRSRFVNSVRIAHGGRPSPDAFGLVLSYGDAASGFGGGDHTILAPLRGDDPWFLHPGDRSPGASSHDPRDGGPSADLHHGGFEAPPFRDPPSFHRVCGESGVAQGQDGSGIARDDQLRRMDRRAPLCAAQGVRPERRGILVRRRRVGGSEGRVEHADRQGDGRLFRGLRHERRGPCGPSKGFRCD